MQSNDPHNQLSMEFSLLLVFHRFGRKELCLKLNVVVVFVSSGVAFFYAIF